MFSPLEEQILAQMIGFGTDLPYFLDTVSTPERIQAVALLARRFPSIPASVAGALIANPLSVVLAYPKDVPPGIGPEGTEGLPKIDLSEFEAQFADDAQANARDREQELEDAQDDSCTSSEMTAVEYLASLIGKVLGQFGLDRPGG